MHELRGDPWNVIKEANCKKARDLCSNLITHQKSDSERTSCRAIQHTHRIWRSRQRTQHAGATQGLPNHFPVDLIMSWHILHSISRATSGDGKVGRAACHPVAKASKRGSTGKPGYSSSLSDVAASVGRRKDTGACWGCFMFLAAKGYWSRVTPHFFSTSLFVMAYLADTDSVSWARFCTLGTKEWGQGRRVQLQAWGWLVRYSL